MFSLRAARARLLMQLSALLAFLGPVAFAQDGDGDFLDGPLVTNSTSIADDSLYHCNTDDYLSISPQLCDPDTLIWNVTADLPESCVNETQAEDLYEVYQNNDTTLGLLDEALVEPCIVWWKKFGIEAARTEAPSEGPSGMPSTAPIPTPVLDLPQLEFTLVFAPSDTVLAVDQTRLVDITRRHITEIIRMDHGDDSGLTIANMSLPTTDLHVLDDESSVDDSLTTTFLTLKLTGNARVKFGTLSQEELNDTVVDAFKLEQARQLFLLRLQLAADESGKATDLPLVTQVVFGDVGKAVEVVVQDREKNKGADSQIQDNSETGDSDQGEWFETVDWSSWPMIAILASTGAMLLIVLSLVCFILCCYRRHRQGQPEQNNQDPKNLPSNSSSKDTGGHSKPSTDESDSAGDDIEKQNLPKSIPRDPRSRPRHPKTKKPPRVPGRRSSVDSQNSMYSFLPDNSQGDDQSLSSMQSFASGSFLYSIDEMDAAHTSEEVPEESDLRVVGLASPEAKRSPPMNAESPSTAPTAHQRNTTKFEDLWKDDPLASAAAAAAARGAAEANERDGKPQFLQSSVVSPSARSLPSSRAAMDSTTPSPSARSLPVSAETQCSIGHHNACSVEPSRLLARLGEEETEQEAQQELELQPDLTPVVTNLSTMSSNMNDNDDEEASTGIDDDAISTGTSNMQLDSKMRQYLKVSTDNPISRSIEVDGTSSDTDDNDSTAMSEASSIRSVRKKKLTGEWAAVLGSSDSSIISSNSTSTNSTGGSSTRMKTRVTAPALLGPRSMDENDIDEVDMDHSDGSFENVNLTNLNSMGAIGAGIKSSSTFDDAAATAANEADDSRYVDVSSELEASVLEYLPESGHILGLSQSESITASSESSQQRKEKPAAPSMWRTVNRSNVAANDTEQRSREEHSAIKVSSLIHSFEHAAVGSKHLRESPEPRKSGSGSSSSQHSSTYLRQHPLNQLKNMNELSQEISEISRADDTLDNINNVSQGGIMFQRSEVSHDDADKNGSALLSVGNDSAVMNNSVIHQLSSLPQKERMTEEEKKAEDSSDDRSLYRRYPLLPSRSMDSIMSASVGGDDTEISTQASF